MWFIVATLVAYIVIRQIGCRVISPAQRYLSRRKRRAMRLAMLEFARQFPNDELEWKDCGIFFAEPDKDFAFLQRRGTFHPPSYVGYVVQHARNSVEYIGDWQFHWGIMPKHAVAWYESRVKNQQVI